MQSAPKITIKLELTAVDPVPVGADRCWLKCRRLPASRSRGRLAEDREWTAIAGRSSRYSLRGQRLPLLPSVFVYPALTECAQVACTVFSRSTFTSIARTWSGYHSPTLLHSVHHADLLLPIVFKCRSRRYLDESSERFARSDS